MPLFLGYVLILQCTSHNLVNGRTEFKAESCFSYKYSSFHSIFITSVDKQCHFMLLEESGIWLSMYISYQSEQDTFLHPGDKK